MLGALNEGLIKLKRDDKVISSPSKEPSYFSLQVTLFFLFFLS